MFHRVLTLILKELQGLVQNPQSRVLLIMPVFLQLILFPAAATLEVRNNTLAVFDQDGGAESSELIQRFAQAKAFSGVMVLRSEIDLQKAIENQKALLAVRFSPDFSRQLARGENAPLQVILDGRRSNSGQIALGYLQTITQSYLDERGAKQGMPAPASFTVRHWYNPNLNYSWFIVPSLISLISTISLLIVTALSVAREREQGTLDQLLVTPLTQGMIMVGKAVPAVIVAFFQANLILLAAVYVYRIPFNGSLGLIYAGLLCYSVAMIGFGLLISAYCATQQQAFLGVFSFMMPAVMLSGYVAPVENMPGWLQAITWANPLRHFLVIVKGVYLKNVSAAVAWEHMWPLLVIATVTLTAARLAFRKRVA